MPISNTDLQELAKVSLDEYLRNLPVDQIAVERPFLKKLMEGRKSLLGAKQNVVENIRKEHGSNFSWAFGEETVKFNKRNTTEQASFPWRRAVDGLYIDYDRLFSNGIKVRKGGARGFQLEYNERVQLINLLDEQLEVLREGFLNKLDLELHRDGSHGADAVVGLDSLVSLAPDAGTVGGIDRAKASYWRNYAVKDIASTSPGNLVGEMETAWRQCIKHGGSPDFIIAGGKFIDIGGADVTNLLEDEKTFGISVRLNQANRNDVSDLAQLLVSGPDGIKIPLSMVADIELGEGLFFIYREAGKPYIAIKFSVRGRDLGECR
jgi:AcrB/AcrD/AcrF family